MMRSGMAGMGEVEELTPSRNNNNNKNTNNNNTTTNHAAAAAAAADSVDEVRTTTPPIPVAPLLCPNYSTTTTETERQAATIPVPATTERRRRKRRTRNRTKHISSPSGPQQQQQQPQQQIPYLRHKEQEIADLLAQPVVDLWKLRALAISPGGLVTDTLRKRAWPKLVGLDHNFQPLRFDDILLAFQQQQQQEDASNRSPHTKPKKKHTPSTSDTDPHQQRHISSSDMASSSSPMVPTIEIAAEHELLQHIHPPTSTSTSSTPRLVVESMDTVQIERDVARCTWHLLTGSQRKRQAQHRTRTKNSTRGNQVQQRLQQQQRKHYRRNRKITLLLKKKQQRLANLINLTLVKSYDQTQTPTNRLRYYQGYHDVACVFLHALGGAGSGTTSTRTHVSSAASVVSDEGSTLHTEGPLGGGDLILPSKVLCQVSWSHFPDALSTDFIQLQTGLKLILFPLLRHLDVTVHDHLLDADMEPFFCLSWIITWFAHDVRDTPLVKRLFDFFLVGHPLVPIYTALSMITHPYNRKIILDTECDFAALHQCLASLPKHSSCVGYKKRESCGDIITYVSDNDTDRDADHEDEHSAGDDHSTVVVDDEDNSTYGEEQRSIYDDDTMSYHTHDTSVCTDTSFSMGANSANQSIASNSMTNRSYSYGEGMTLSASIHNTTATTTGSSSLATGTLASCPADRSVLSSETDFGTGSTEDGSRLTDGVGGSSLNDPWVAIHSSRNTNGRTSNPAQTTNTPALNVTNNQNSSTTENFLMDDHNPVPFESVLETALQLMKRYPPSSLVSIAKSYYRDDWESQVSLLAATVRMQEQSPPDKDSAALAAANANAAEATTIDVEDHIALLNPYPPPWSIVPFCKSDWIEKQRSRQELGLKPTSRNDRRRYNRIREIHNKKNLIPHQETPTKANTTSNDMLSVSSDPDNYDTKPLPVLNDGDDPMEYIRANPDDLAVAAVGYGGAGGLEARKKRREHRHWLRQQHRRKRRRRRAIVMLTGCVGIAFIGAVAYSLQTYPNPESLYPFGSTSRWLWNRSLPPPLSSSSSCPSSTPTVVTINKTIRHPNPSSPSHPSPRQHQSAPVASIHSARNTRTREASTTAMGTDEKQCTTTTATVSIVRQRDRSHTTNILARHVLQTRRLLKMITHYVVSLYRRLFSFRGSWKKTEDSAP